MNNFLKKIVEGNNVNPSEECLISFNNKFSEAVNIEWSKKKEMYEAIFYRNSIEHIALFTFEGELVEYSQNITVDFLPVQIKDTASLKGEIMNSVLKNKGNNLEYEVIVRDSLLKRYVLVFSDAGIIKHENTL